MASMKCAACGRTMDAAASRCPACGARAPLRVFSWRGGVLIAVTVTTCLVLLRSGPPDDDDASPPPDDTAAAVPTSSVGDAAPPVDVDRLRLSDEKASEAVDRFMGENGLAPEDLPGRTGLDESALIAQLRTRLYADDEADPAALIAQMQSARGGSDSTALAALVASGEQ